MRKAARACSTTAPAPNTVPRPENPRAGMTDLWVYQQSPAPLSGERDDGALPYHFEPPPAGGHLRIVQSTKPPPGYDPAKDPTYVPFHEPQRARGRRAGARRPERATPRAMHKSETVDYGSCSRASACWCSTPARW